MAAHMDEGSPLAPVLRKLEYRAKFTPEDRAAFLSLPHTVRQVEAHTYLVREFDRPTQCFCLLSGYAMRHKLVANGQRQIVSIHMKGEFVDMQNSMFSHADHSVQMLTAGRVAALPRQEVVRLAFERPTIGRAMWIDSLVDSSIFREWIVNVGRREARARIAHLMCELALRMRVAGLGQQTDYEMPLTQEQLADATGLTPVHVNRTIKALELDGLIKRVGPRFITIGDWRKLAEAGDFNSGYLHLQEDDPALHA